MATSQPSRAALKLAARLRGLREDVRLTQADLGRALGIKATAISQWESPTNERLPSPDRLRMYARLFCTERSFTPTGLCLLDSDQLTEDERDRLKALEDDLLGLRELTTRGDAQAEADEARSLWHFPDGGDITLVCGQLTDEDDLPPHADVKNLHYVRAASFADLDTVIDIHGQVRAENPKSRVTIITGGDLNLGNINNHIILIGGIAVNAATEWFSQQLDSPVSQLPRPEVEEKFKRDIFVVEESGVSREFSPKLKGDQMIEDVGLFVGGPNPSAPERTLTIFSGITTRGVRGAALCFIDPLMRERNGRYVASRRSEGSTYCVMMRVPVLNAEPTIPDLTKERIRLYEWSDSEVVDSARGLLDN